MKIRILLILLQHHFRCSETSPVIHPNDRRGVRAGREQYVKDGSPKQPATLKFCVICLNSVDFVLSFNPCFFFFTYVIIKTLKNGSISVLNVVLISSVQHHESATCNHISLCLLSLPPISRPHPTSPHHPRASS